MPDHSSLGTSCLLISVICGDVEDYADDYADDYPDDYPDWLDVA